MLSSISRRLLGAPAALLVVVLAAAACGSAVPDHGRSPVRAVGQTTYFAQYGVSTHAYKPRRLNPSVDGSLFVQHMRWTTWDARKAVGTGVAHVNDCRPSCAEGHYSSYRVTVRLTRPRHLCGSRFFTTIRVSGSGYRTYGHRSGVGCQ
jgi:hypothetical protein